MKSKCRIEDHSYIPISGNPATDRALFGLEQILWEIAQGAVDREVPREQIETRPAEVMTEPQRLVLKPSEVAEALAVSRGTVYEMIRRGEIPSIRMGRNVRVPRKALERWLVERQTPAQ